MTKSKREIRAERLMVISAAIEILCQVRVWIAGGGTSKQNPNPEWLDEHVRRRVAEMIAEEEKAMAECACGTGHGGCGCSEQLGFRKWLKAKLWMFRKVWGVGSMAEFLNQRSSCEGEIKYVPLVPTWMKLSPRLTLVGKVVSCTIFLVFATILNAFTFFVTEIICRLLWYVAGTIVATVWAAFSMIFLKVGGCRCGGHGHAEKI